MKNFIIFFFKKSKFVVVKTEASADKYRATKKPAKLNSSFHFRADIVGSRVDCLQKSIRMIFKFFKKVQIILKEG